MKTAIYLFGQGSKKGPRFIELQYLRILRYKDALNDLGFEIFINEVFIDLNSIREDLVDRMPHLAKLCALVNNKEIECVLLDITPKSAFGLNTYFQIITLLKSYGAKVFNCYSDDENAIKKVLERRLECNILFEDLPTDEEDFLILFPEIAANITCEIQSEWIQVLPESINNKNSKSLSRKVNFLRKQQPYKGNTLPLIGFTKANKLRNLRK